MGLVLERLLLQAPQVGIGGVEELEPHVRAEDGDSAAERLQHLGMGRDVPLELALQLLASRPIERHADGSAKIVCGPVPARSRRVIVLVFALGRYRDLEQLHEPPLAGHHRVQALGADRAALKGAPGKRAADLCLGLARQFGGLADHGFGVAPDRRGIGAVAVIQGVIGAAPPHRRRQGIEDGEGGIPLGLGLGNGAGDLRTDVFQLLAELRQLHARASAARTLWRKA
jgi:hypothetical protein